MAHFLSGCDYKKFFLMLLVTASLFLTTVEQRAAAQCDPGWWGGWIGGGCGGHWYVPYPKPIPAESRTVLETSTIFNKGCDRPGESPPVGTCGTKSGTTKVTNWEISGSLTYDICSQANITVGADYGKSHTHSYGAYSSHTVSDFCQTCFAEAGLSYIITTYNLLCTCGSGQGRQGTVIKFNGGYTRGGTGILPNPPCNPNCPSGE